VSEKAHVAFEPSGVTVIVESGTLVTEAIRLAGLRQSTPCGGRGTCGGCSVKLLAGSLAPPDEVELRSLKNAPPNIRLACRAKVDGPVTLGLRELQAAHVDTPSVDVISSAAVVVAVDVGTTTVTAGLYDLTSGARLAQASTLNLQSRFGSDLVSRVSAARAGHLETLKLDARRSMWAALTEAAHSLEIDLHDIRRVAVVGNPVMTSTLMGIDPSPLAEAPFTTPDIASLTKDPGRVGEILGFECDAFILPPLAGFVGADFLAGLLAIDARVQTDCMYVDMGTNVEIAVMSHDSIVVASAPAGPAFEGNGIICGSVYGPGSVIDVDLVEGRLELKVVHDNEPLTICGSGLISLVALLRETGHLDKSGRLWRQGPLSRYFDILNREPMIRLCESSACPYLTQADVRSFQVAKASVQAAIQMLIDVSGAVVSRMIVSGGFGGEVLADDLRKLGVLPECVEAVSVHTDSALEGASLVALDPTTSLARTEVIRLSVVHHELVASPSFSEVYTTAMSFGPSR